MSKQMMNRFECDHNSCGWGPTYTVRAIPDGWVSFEYGERRLWVCPLHAADLERMFGEVTPDA